MQRVNSNKLSLLLEEFVKDHGLEEGLLSLRVGEAWDSVVGQKYALYTLSKYFSNGTLYCKINSSLVRNQLYFRQNDIIVQINKNLGGEIVRSLVLR
ncbi:MAG: DUF721 domain-containing protein [Bacteroidales bacterium]|nr:DUF721 domain-containing protein [Bacteroidales bacterium]